MVWLLRTYASHFAFRWANRDGQGGLTDRLTARTGCIIRLYGVRLYDGRYVLALL